MTRDNDVPVPGVYRFIAPDGRSYVGSTKDHRNRGKIGLHRDNARMVAAFEIYPRQTWTYELLEELPIGYSKQERLRAERRHIERLRTWMPEHGFNVIRIAPEHIEQAALTWCSQCLHYSDRCDCVSLR